MARAIWKGRLIIGKENLPVRLYSAIQDTKVHFRLLDKHGKAPVHQRIVRKTDHEEVPKAEQRKAFPLDDGRAVVFTADELDELEPKESRDIQICRFIPPGLLGDQWYDRPYYLGPDNDKDAKRYFALAQALAEDNVIGISRWVMRKSRYVGALTPFNGYLTLVTLRRAEQIVSVPAVQLPHEPDKKELKLAAQLVESIAGDFDPAAWQDEYHERVCELIAAKEKGKKPKVHAPKRKRVSGGLAAALRQSIATAKEEKPAHA